jgi:phenylalanyl-tRNA synthetase alpha chain
MAGPIGARGGRATPRVSRAPFSLLACLLLTAAAPWTGHRTPAVAVVVGAFAPAYQRGTAAGRSIKSPFPPMKSPLLPLRETRERSDAAAAPTSPSSSSSQSSSAGGITIESVQEELASVEETLAGKLEEASTVADVEALRREYMGKKGPVARCMGYMRGLADDDKPKLGAVVNQVKDRMETLIADRMGLLETRELEEEMLRERIDVTMPGLARGPDIGRRHPLSMTMERAVDVFVRLGYDTVTDARDSPEIETDYYCFEALNCPKDHPARDMQDTFYLSDDLELLLRTHTSAVQIRQLEKRTPPLRIVAPGRVYRKDDIDATHSLMFHQVEILALEKRGELDLGHLKGTVEHFLQQMLGPDIETRFRGSYFPFTEPSMEVDVKFRGKWLEGE